MEANRNYPFGSESVKISLDYILVVLKRISFAGHLSKKKVRRWCWHERVRFCDFAETL